jgi:hypothetical protein
VNFIANTRAEYLRKKMMRIIDYKVLYEGGADTMTAAVMACIKEGWQPLGGPQPHGAYTSLSQAMVKYESYTAQSSGPR